MRIGKLLAAAAAAAIAAGAAHADSTGITDTTIKIGNTNPYSGPLSVYSVIGKTISAYYDMVNAEGGIQGRQIEFISLDDGYSPPRTVEQVRKLVEQEQVAFLFNTLGTPTNTAVHRYVNARKVPHLFLATGASKWGQPDKYPWTMGFQPTYDVEGEIYAKYVLENVEDPKIAILFQNDDYGKDYRDGFLRRLGDRAEELVVSMLPYEVTDPTVDSRIVALKDSGANVFFNITSPKFAAQAIRKSCEIDWKPVHLLNNVSASVGATLTPAGLDCSTGLITAIYLKDPVDSQWKDDPGFNEWLDFMETHMPGSDLTDVNYAYAYNVSKLLHIMLDGCADLTRPGIMACAANLKDIELPMALPGILIDTGPDDFYPIQAEQLSRFDGERWVAFGGIIDASK